MRIAGSLHGLPREHFYHRPSRAAVQLLRPVCCCAFVSIASCQLQPCATVRAHVMESFEPELNYFNNTKVKVPKNKLCNLVNHHCDKNHSQLIRFDRICAVCVGTTPNGTFVNAMKLLDQTSPTRIMSMTSNLKMHT